MGGQTDGVRASASRRRCTPRPPRQDYERAARLRDDIGALNRAMEKQAVVLGDGTDADVVALAEDPLEVAVQIFYVRGGRIRGQRGWVADKVDDADTGGLVERFLLQLYDGELGDAIPREVLVPALPDDAAALEQWLERPAGQPGCRSGCPQRGDKKAPAGDRRPQRAAGAGAAQDQAGQRPDHPQPGARGDPGGARAARRRRCASSATTSRTCRAPRWSPRWWSSRTAWPARASTAAS